MPRRSRPGAATFVAIVNILLGLPCACCVGCITGGQVMEIAGVDPTAGEGDELENVEQVKNPNDPFDGMLAKMEKQERFLAKEVPHHQKLMLVMNVGTLIASIILLVSGFLLLTNMPAGWYAALFGLFLLLVCSSIEVGNNIIFVLPASNKFDAQEKADLQAQGKQNDEVPTAVGLMIAVAATAILGIGYPILGMILLMSGAVRAFYSGGAANDDDYNRYHSDDDDVRRHRQRYDDNDDFDDRFR